MVEQTPEQDRSNPLLLATLATGALVVGAFLYSKTGHRSSEAIQPGAIPESSDIPSQETLLSGIETTDPVVETDRRVAIVADSPEINEPNLQGLVDEFSEQAIPGPCTNIPALFPNEFQNFKSEWLGHLESKRISKAAYLLDSKVFMGRFDPFLDCAEELGLKTEFRRTLLTQLQIENIPEMQGVLLEIIGDGFAIDSELWTGNPNLFPTFESVCADHNCNLLSKIVGLFPNFDDLSESDRRRLTDALLSAIEGSDQALHATRCLPNEYLPYELTNELKEFQVDLSKQIPVLLSKQNTVAQTVGLIALRDYYYQRLSEDRLGEYDERRVRIESEIRPYLTYLPKDSLLNPQVQEAYQALEKHLAGKVYRGPGNCIAASSPVIEPDCQSHPSPLQNVEQKRWHPIAGLLGVLKGERYFYFLPHL